MSGPKPTLGYPSRSAAVKALRAERLSTKEIAKRIGISEKNVLCLEYSVGRSKAKPPPGVAGNRTVLFPIDLIDALGPHAARRGITPNELARRIVEAVVDGKLVDPVLDDGDEVQAYLEGAAR